MDMDAPDAQPEARRHHGRKSGWQSHDVKIFLIVVVGVILTCVLLVLLNQKGTIGLNFLPANPPADQPNDLAR